MIVGKKIVLDKIAYERHPVSLERKRKLNANGFKIIDAVFAPAEVAERQAENAPNPKGEPVEIPADWESLHWKKQVELALALVGGEGPLVPAEGQTEAAKAKAIIAAEVAERAA